MSRTVESRPRGNRSDNGHKPDVSAKRYKFTQMRTHSTPTTVAILAMPETGVSTVYGMFDLFMATGRDWGMLVDGVPGPQLIAPRVVARGTTPFAAGNGVRIQADLSLADCAPPDIVCIPELLVGPDEPFAGRFEPE